MTDTTTDPAQGEPATLKQMLDSQTRRLERMRSRPAEDFASRFHIAAVEKQIETLKRRIAAEV